MKFLFVVLGIVLVFGTLAWVFITLSQSGTLFAEPARAPLAPRPSEGDVEVSAARLQYILESRPEKTSLPKNTRILVKFFDRDEKFLLSGREIKEYNGEDYDMEIETGDYYLNDIENDLCSAINLIRNNQDYIISKNKNVVFLAIKYGKLLKYKNLCE